MTWRPGKRFRVGAMRERITIQTFTTSQNAAGQPVATWANSLTNEPARFVPVAGGTSYRGRQLEEFITAVFEIHYRSSGVNVECRVIHDGQTYGITRVEFVDGGRRYMALHCRGVAA